MKFNYLVKAIPFLTSIVLIIFLGFSNQKQTTKINILIWETPSLSLGKYLSISIGSGFVLSFLVTNILSNLNKPRLKKVLKTKSENNHEENIDNTEHNTFDSYDYTLIERDIKEPSPTVNARFRVIGKTSTINSDSINNNSKNIINEDTYELQDIYPYENESNYQRESKEQLSLDWNDQSFLNW